MKKQNLILKSLLVFVSLLVSIQVQAELSKTVHVATAGTLNTLITDDEKSKITELIVTGDLNGTDIVFMKSLGNSETQGNLSLDLTDANIVAGGGVYHSDMHYSYYTSNNTIGEYMFYAFPRLGSIKIPRSVTTIGNEAFRFCLGLKSLTIPEGVATIGYYAFEECPIQSLTLPASLTSIEHNAFSRCGMSSVTLPTGITTMDGAVFEHCYNLTSVTIPSNIKQIAYNTFSDCIKLTSITIPETVTSIGIGAFKGSGLTSITIPASIDTIEESTFEECRSLTTVTLPSTMRTIGGRSFHNCYYLSSITLPESIEEIGYDAFSNCVALTSITIPASVTSIQASAFNGCSSIKEIYSLNVTPPIADISCFNGIYKNSCTLYVPYYASPNYFATAVWKDFPHIEETFTAGNLKYAINADSVTVIGYVNKPKGNLDIDKEVEYNGKFYTITAIKDYAFNECDSLERVTTLLTLRTIGSCAFKNCSGLKEFIFGAYLYYVTSGDYQLSQNSAKLIGESILPPTDSIGSHAFQGCYALNYICVHQKTPPKLGADVFSDVNKSTCSLYVPYRTNSKYAAADQWKDFKKIYIFYPDSEPENEASQATIFTEPDGIVVKGAEAGTIITVYSATGIQKIKLIANGDEQRIALPAGALYLVKVGDQTFKITLLQ